ncbi:uncharacterized protein LOC125646238 [Ostrea edulis]|uniref:uncharacterized protein LOC125646238 n=1 Tax=Ostrea edulis TaxID=37623 RepID=UPI0024AFC794|nr:uncharacterized protein LOC125646238 [Ostrea edulis]
MGLIGEKLQDSISKFVFMVIIFFLATATRGEWVLVIVYMFRDQLQNLLAGQGIQVSGGSVHNVTGPSPTLLESLKLQNIHWFVLLAVSTSFIMYYGLAFGWHYYYYVNRQHLAKEWKCQPDKFLTPENERHEILLGSLNMMIGSVASGVIACFIMNGGSSKMYYNVSERGWGYFIFSLVAFFVYNETMAYYLHRLFHNPWLYRNIHKMHHRYHQPTAWSAVAMHPAEFLMYQGYLAATPFLVPIHAFPFLFVLLYSYYYGLCDHSGINMEAIWPWQPHSRFHDNHHKHFHVNFGFNTYFFDWFHDTLRKENRVYGEEVYGGRGKPTLKSE